jgi:hypothetical protein
MCLLRKTQIQCLIHTHQVKRILFTEGGKQEKMRLHML